MYPENKIRKGYIMLSKRTLLIIIVIIVLIVGAIIVSDANRRGEAITQGIEDIVDR
jgi:hypothetical protein